MLQWLEPIQLDFVVLPSKYFGESSVENIIHLVYEIDRLCEQASTAKFNDHQVGWASQGQVDYGTAGE